jgi:hypothetical protein
MRDKNGKNVKVRGLGVLRHYLSTWMQGVGKCTRDLRVADMRAEFWTQDFPPYARRQRYQLRPAVPSVTLVLYSLTACCTHGGGYSGYRFPESDAV